MSKEASTKTSLKQKAAHELQQYVGIFLYLAIFFFAIATYTIILLGIADWRMDYAYALINALVIAKVILVGEHMHLGRKYESKPLLLSSLYKAFLFGLLVFVFHHVEEVIKHLLHGETMAEAFHAVRNGELLARSVVIACAFLTFFAFRELRRVLGEDKFHDLFFVTGPERFVT